MASNQQLEFIRRVVFQVADKQINPKAAMELIEVFLRDSGPPATNSKGWRKRQTIEVENGRRNWTAEMDQTMLDLLNSGLSVENVAGRLGRTVRAIETRIQNLKRVRAIGDDSRGQLEFLMGFDDYEAIVKAYQARSKRRKG
jgi:DNA-binding NarL/FixJ family response regulator